MLTDKTLERSVYNPRPLSASLEQGSNITKDRLNYS